jgi:hypothetical protein
MADERYIIDGFKFETKEEALDAKNEYEGVMYMRSRTNMSNPANVYSVYKSIVEKNLFKTPVGMKYLCELRQALEKSGQYKEELESLPVYVPRKTATQRDLKKEKKADRRQVIKEMKDLGIESVYRNRFINAVLLNIILIIALILILMITGNSSNTNILNYKNRLDAQYAEKENDLVKWKKELQSMADELQSRENELENEPTDK